MYADVSKQVFWEEARRNQIQRSRQYDGMNTGMMCFEDGEKGHRKPRSTESLKLKRQGETNPPQSS